MLVFFLEIPKNENSLEETNVLAYLVFGTIANLSLRCSVDFFPFCGVWL